MVRNISGQEIFAKKFLEFKATIEQLKQNLEEVTAAKDALVRENESLHAQLENALNAGDNGVDPAEVEKIRKDLQTSQKKAESLEKTADELQSKIAEIEKSRDEYRTEFRALEEFFVVQGKLEDPKHGSAQIKKYKEEADKYIKAQEAKLQKADNKIKTLTASAKQIKADADKQINDLQEENNSLKLTVAILTDKVQVLEETIVDINKKKTAELAEKDKEIAAANQRADAEAQRADANQAAASKSTLNAYVAERETEKHTRAQARIKEDKEEIEFLTKRAETAENTAELNALEAGAYKEISEEEKRRADKLEGHAKATDYQLQREKEKHQKSTQTVAERTKERDEALKSKGFIKKGLKVVAAAGIFVLAAGVFFSAMFGTNAARNEEQAAAWENAYGIVAINEHIESTIGDYDQITNDWTYAEKINPKSNSGSVARASLMSTKTGQLTDYEIINTAKESADSIMTFDDGKQVAEDSKLGIAKNNYLNAVDAGDKADMEKYAEEIAGYAEEMDSYAVTTSESLQRILDIIEKPTISINDADFGADRKDFNVVGRKWNVDQVLSCDYQKDSGLVNMVIECSNRGETVISLIKFSMDAGLITLTSDEVTEAYNEAKAANELASMNYSILQTSIEGTTATLNNKTGKVSIGYNISTTNDNEWHKVSGSAIIMITNDAGELIEKKIVSASTQKCKENEVVNKTDTVINDLLNKINSTLGTNAELTTEAEHEAE